MGKYGRLKVLEFCDNNGVLLDVIPDKCNRETRVSGQCNIVGCDDRFEKDLRQLFDETGPSCTNCVNQRTRL